MNNSFFLFFKLSIAKLQIIFKISQIFLKNIFDIPDFICKEKTIQINKSKALTIETFIEKAKLTHGNLYIYSNIKYINNGTKVCVICPIHGEFWVTPAHHLEGVGCPKCKRSHIEYMIEKLLQNNNINFISQWKNNIIGSKSIDFYLPDYNIAIECQGTQHFFPVKFFGGEKKFIQQIQYDEEKYNQLTENGIDVIYFTNIKNIPKEFTDKHTYLSSLNDVLEIINKKSRQMDDEILEIFESN